MLTLIMTIFTAVAAAAPGGFDVFVDSGRLHRLEGGPGAGVALYYRRSDDGGRTWTEPARVDGGRSAYHFGAGDARVAGRGDDVFALWARPGEGPHGSGPLAAARSTDGGRTWREAASPSGAGSFGRRFPALAISSGVLHAVWLDRSSRSKVMVSRSADAAASWSKPVTLDGDACECCWNAVVAGGDAAVYALYRGKNPRDMNAAVSRDGGRTWSKPSAAGAFGWDFNGCPHVGGSLASTPSGVAALVWTGKDEQAGLYALSSVGGKNWGSPARLGGPGAKHADLVSSGARLAAVWDDGGAIWGAVSADGKSWSRPSRLSGEASASHPRVVPAGDHFRAFWTTKDVYVDAVLK